MSVEQFSKTIQSQIYKQWLTKLDKNIITNSAKSLRASQQTAAKTDFYITKDTVMDMYKSITGKKMESTEADVLLFSLSEPQGTGTNRVQGTFSTIGGSKAVLFKSIGFDTISTRLIKVFEEDYLVQESYRKAEENYIKNQMAELNKRTDLKGRDKQNEIDKIEAEAKRQSSFGYYFNKGHVIGIATNLTKQFRDDIAKADDLAEKERKMLTQVLDQYIAKLQADDLASANLPNAVDQELYAGYIKSSSKYLVEIQCAVKNQGAGREQTSPILDELRKLFDITTADITGILNNSPTLGRALTLTEGSPSYIDLIAKDIVEIIKTGKKPATKIYKQASKLIGKKSTKVIKPKNNKATIQKLKQLKSKVQAVKSDPKKIIVEPNTINLPVLLLFINQHLQDVISANMGDGSRRDILNYRTGRFAASAEVTALSQSREGMITAFYSYMKNPYATFSEGGKQVRPSSRDPKLLIGTSIKEIAAQQVTNRLRAVLV